MAQVSMQTPNDLMTVFSNTVSEGFAALQGPVNGVFGSMIALVVALTGIQWALSSNREVLASGFGKVLLIGSFAYLINDWERLSLLVQAGFVDLGLTAGGSTLSRADFLNPGAILQQGWEIVKALGETPAPMGSVVDVIGSLTDALILGLAMIGIMIAFAVLALQIIVTLLEFKIVTLGGFVLLPFGIWSKSAFLAERPLGFVVASGLKVLALAIVVSGARSVFDQLQPSANPDLYEALAILAAALLLAMLALFIPNLAAALVSGGPALGAGALASGVLAVGGTGAGLAAGAAGLGAAAARIATPARAAAGANNARPVKPLLTPRLPPGSGRGGASGGGAPSEGPAGGGPGRSAGRAGGTGPGRPPPGERSTTPGRQAADPPPGADPPSPAADRIADEIEAARRDFHRAAQGAPRAAHPRLRTGRGAALQAFFVANAGRALLPGNETSGAINPKLDDEEA